jgi:probable HAF family extracellular repeat protein
MHTRKFFHLTLALSGLLLASCAVIRVPTVPTYRVAVALPNDIAVAINAHGDFVGINTGTLRGFVYSRGVRTELATLGGDYSFAGGINDARDVVGDASLPDNSTHAVLARHGLLRDLGTLGGDYSSAADINNAGTIVGTSRTSDGSLNPFIYTNGRMRDLGTLGDNFNVGTAINNRGQAVGYASLPHVPGAVFHAVLFERGVVRDLGTFDGTGNSFAYNINDAGHIVGEANSLANPNYRAFLFRARTGMVSLGTLGGASSAAYGINNLGQVVGGSQTAESRSHAFLYIVGRMIDINTLVDPALGWEFDAASGINDRGQIIASGCRADGCFAVRLDPVWPRR